jgi:hypothetical protein
MIEPKEVRLHPPTGNDLYSAETNHFSFYVPEASPNGCVYVLTRANVEATDVGSLAASRKPVVR